MKGEDLGEGASYDTCTVMDVKTKMKALSYWATLPVPFSTSLTKAFTPSQALSVRLPGLLRKCWYLKAVKLTGIQKKQECRPCPHLGTTPGHDVLRGGQDLPGQRALDGKVRDDDGVFGVLAPGFKQLPGKAGLQHGGCGHDHTGANALQIPGPTQLLDVLELERVGALQHKREFW